jgi:hypothetical protein
MPGLDVAPDANVVTSGEPTGTSTFVELTVLADVH